MSSVVPSMVVIVQYFLLVHRNIIPFHSFSKKWKKVYLEKNALGFVCGVLSGLKYFLQYQNALHCSMST